MSIWNTANIAHVSRAGLAASVLVTLSATLAEATYGPRTVFGANYQQTSDTTSLNGINQSSCNGAGFCHVLFQPAPNQKRLIVQYVSCVVRVSAGELRHGILRTRKGQTFPQKRTHLTPVRTAGISWVVNSPVMHLIESGERPFVTLVGNLGADWDIECNISGRLIQP